MKKLVLAGSGEFTPAMRQIDQYLLELLQKDNLPLKVSILPTAAGLESDFLKWINNGVNYFKELGTNPQGLEVLKRRDTENPKYLKKINDSSLIYFSGGDPGYLLSVLKESLLWQKILEQIKVGKILAGSSAGAMVMGNYVLSNAQTVFSKSEQPRWEKALSLVPFAIIPHFDYMEKKHSEKLNQLLNAAPKEIQQNWLGVDEDTVLFLTEGKALVMGKGKVKVVRDGKESLFKNNQEIPKELFN